MVFNNGALGFIELEQKEYVYDESTSSISCENSYVREM
jgi:hypothetical protein